MKPYQNHFGLYTAAHMKLLEALARQNMPVLSEVPVQCGRVIFRMDLLIGGKLAVEVDGDSHLGMADRDNQRDQVILKTHGIKTLRFSNAQIKKDLRTVVETIKGEWLKNGGRRRPF